MTRRSPDAVMSDAPCRKCTPEEDCGEHVASWEELARYWRTRALELEGQLKACDETIAAAFVTAWIGQGE